MLTKSKLESEKERSQQAAETKSQSKRDKRRGNSTLTETKRHEGHIQPRGNPSMGSIKTRGTNLSTQLEPPHTEKNADKVKGKAYEQFKVIKE